MNAQDIEAARLEAFLAPLRKNPNAHLWQPGDPDRTAWTRTRTDGRREIIPEDQLYPNAIAVLQSRADWPMRSVRKPPSEWAPTSQWTTEDETFLITEVLHDSYYRFRKDNKYGAQPEILLADLECYREIMDQLYRRFEFVNLWQKANETGCVHILGMRLILSRVPGLHIQ